MTRALLFGAGSLGIPYTWVLCRALGEANVTAVCRSNFDSASRDGFTIHSKLWGENLRCRPRVARTAAEAAAQIASEPQPFFDYVVVAAKAARAVPSVAELVGPAATPGKTAAVALVQNGIAVEEEYATRYYPDTAVLSCVAYFPATQTEPAVVRHKEVEMLHIGAYSPPGSKADDAVTARHAEAARAFAELIRRGGAKATLHADVQRERWVKLLVNAAWNPVCALTRLRDREFMESTKKQGGEEEEEEDALGFVRDVMREIAAVARACGHPDVDDKLVEFQIGRARARDLPGVQPSMLTDAVAGRAMEVDAIVGNTVRLAREKGVPVPMLRTLYFLANGLNESFSRDRV
ncbi:6-phosphogluconate dehydrogenase C-terminal domain-like protein [Hypoxylon sp. FL1284]|nr:6-phosphogluconate dehydrogenase C-terminal domain-like protein [Hypoxylon sp. FL1284]